MNKFLSIKKNIIFVFFFLFFISSCSLLKNEKIDYKNDIEYQKTGYFIDIASKSDADILDLLSNVQMIEKPKSYGEIKLPNIKNIVINTEKIKEVEDSEVEAYLEELKDENAKYVEAPDKKIAYGDKVVANIDINIIGQKNPFEQLKDFEFVVGDENINSDLSEKIVDHTKNEYFAFVTKYNKPDQNIYNLDVMYKVVVKNVFDYVIPENEEILKEKFDEGLNFELFDYRAEIKNLLTKRKNLISDIDVQTKLLNNLVESSIIELNEEAVIYEFPKLIKEQFEIAKMENISIEQYFKNMNLSIDQVIQEFRILSKQVATKNLVLSEISKKYNIKVNDEDIQSWFNDIKIINDYEDITYEEYVDVLGKDYCYEKAREKKILSSIFKYIQINYVSGE